MKTYIYKCNPVVKYDLHLKLSVVYKCVKKI